MGIPATTVLPIQSETFTGGRCGTSIVSGSLTRLSTVTDLTPAQPSEPTTISDRLAFMSYRALVALVVLSPAIAVLTFWPYSDDVFAGSKYVALRVVAILIGVAAAGASTHAGATGRWVAVDGAVIAWVVLTFLSQVFSVDPGLSWHGEALQLQGAITTALYGVAYGSARLAYTSRVTRPLLAVVVGSACLAAAYGLIQLVGWDPIWPDLLRGRIFSTVGQPNPLAAVLVVGVVLALGLSGSSRWRWAWRFVAVVIALSLAVTLSRGAYLALGLVAVAFLVGQRRMIGRDRFLVGFAISLVAVVVLSVAVPAGDRVIDRVGSLFGPLDTSNRDRLDLWLIGGVITLDRPLLGTGPDTYAVVFPEYRDEHLSEERIAALSPFRPESPHNVYLAISSGSGIPALLAYLTAIGLAMRMMWRRKASEPWLWWALLATVAHLVTDLFITAEFSGAWTFWIIIGWAVSSAELSDQSAPTDAPRWIATGPEPPSYVSV